MARLHLQHKTYRVDSILGSTDWTVRQNACTVPVRIMQLIDWSVAINILSIININREKFLYTPREFFNIYATRNCDILKHF